MEDNRHPITDAGIGALIDTVARRWAAELSPDESVIVFDSDMTIGPRHCQLIESIHTRRQPDFQFYKVRLFIDSELNLPIRFEGYDWPREPGCSRRPGRGIFLHRTSNSTSASATWISMPAIGSIPSVVSDRSIQLSIIPVRLIRVGPATALSRTFVVIAIILTIRPAQCRYMGNEGDGSARPVVSDRRP